MLQVDSDLLVGRGDRNHDFLGEMIAQFDADDRVVTAAMNIARDAALPFSAGDGGRPWRVEVRGSLVHRERLLAARPLPNQLSSGVDVAERVLAAHRGGTDVTVGSMLRTDKHGDYPVVFEEPRHNRGGNCWQHLRTFRKRLFDAIPDHELRIDGRYVDIAVDWAFMLPIVEMSRRPEWIRQPLYLYEPSGLGKGDGRRARERQIGVLTGRPSRSWARGKPASTLVTPDDVTADKLQDGAILFVRHSERPSFAGLNAQQKHRVSLTARGREMAQELGRRLGASVRFACSSVPRALETAEELAAGAGLDPSTILCAPELMRFLATGQEHYDEVKRRLGWTELMASWMDGSLPQDVLVPCEQVARQALEAVLGALGTPGVVAVTHDFLVMALLAALRGERPTSIPYLAGLLVSRQETERFLGMEVLA